MKMLHTISIFLLIAALQILYASCRNKVQNQAAPSAGDTQHIKTYTLEKNQYNDLRNMALSATAEQIGARLPQDKIKIYGVIMDWNLGDGTVTLVSFLSGDASLYVSSGGAVIGGSAHESVRQAAFAFINKAEATISKASKTETTALPEKDNVKFYFLTNKGKFVSEEGIKNLEDNTSEWTGLFEEGNKLMTAIRLATEEK